MHKEEYLFSKKKVSYFFNYSMNQLQQLVDGDIILLTDQTVFNLHQQKFAGYKK